MPILLQLFSLAVKKIRIISAIFAIIAVTIYIIKDSDPTLVIFFAFVSIVLLVLSFILTKETPKSLFLTLIIHEESGSTYPIEDAIVNLICGDITLREKSNEKGEVKFKIGSDIIGEELSFSAKKNGYQPTNDKQLNTIIKDANTKPYYFSMSKIKSETDDFADNLKKGEAVIDVEIIIELKKLLNDRNNWPTLLRELRKVPMTDTQKFKLNEYIEQYTSGLSDSDVLDWRNRMDTFMDGLPEKEMSPNADKNKKYLWLDRNAIRHLIEDLLDLKNKECLYPIILSNDTQNDDEYFIEYFEFHYVRKFETKIENMSNIFEKIDLRKNKVDVKLEEIKKKIKKITTFSEVEESYQLTAPVVIEFFLDVDKDCTEDIVFSFFNKLSDIKISGNPLYVIVCMNCDEKLSFCADKVNELTRLSCEKIEGFKSLEIPYILPELFPDIDESDVNNFLKQPYIRDFYSKREGEQFTSSMKRSEILKKLTFKDNSTVIH